MPRSIGSARLVWIFSATWCPGLAAGKFCSPTRPATSSSYSNPPAPDRPLEPGGHQPKHRKEDDMTPIIEARVLTKRFGEVRALDGLDLVAESGRVTALLGPNGAGKTTFVSAVATLVRPDGGEIRVAGIDVCAS